MSAPPSPRPTRARGGEPDGPPDDVDRVGVDRVEVVGVEVVDEQDAVAVDGPRWAHLAAHCLATLGVPAPWLLTVRFVDTRTMAALNLRHMGQGGPTDVLSFPVDGPDLAAEAAAGSLGSAADLAVQQAAGPPTVLGDLIICPEVAAGNAPGHAGTADDEMALLVVHGVLHLWGMDHASPDERQAMQAAERALLSAHHGPLAGDPWSDQDAGPSRGPDAPPDGADR